MIAVKSMFAESNVLCTPKYWADGRPIKEAITLHIFPNVFKVLIVTFGKMLSVYTSSDRGVDNNLIPTVWFIHFPFLYPTSKRVCVLSFENVCGGYGPNQPAWFNDRSRTEDFAFRRIRAGTSECGSCDDEKSSFP